MNSKLTSLISKIKVHLSLGKYSKISMPSDGFFCGFFAFKRLNANVKTKDFLQLQPKSLMTDDNMAFLYKFFNINKLLTIITVTDLSKNLYSFLSDEGKFFQQDCSNLLLKTDILMILNNHWFIIKIDMNVKSDPINIDNISDIIPSYIETPPSFSNYILSVKSDIYNFVCDNFFEDSEDNNLQFIVSFDPTILDLYTDYIRFKSKYEFSINNYYKLIEDIILEQDIESKIPKNFIFLDSLRRLKNKKTQEEVFYDRCKFLSHDLELIRDTNLLEIDEETNEIYLDDVEQKKKKKKM